MIDAFNGKVDSILADSRADNFGTLRQRIIDAYATVNMNGRAFRGAKILQVYCDARIDELRWACVAYELREKEREEQRRIKEQIREEEKARRDFERAQREVAKEGRRKSSGRQWSAPNANSPALAKSNARSTRLSCKS